MWRAWGVFLFFVFQDLAPRFFSRDHELAICPPTGWKQQLGAGPTLAKYTAPGEAKIPAEIMVSHLHSSNPTPLIAFKAQARDHINEKFKGAKIVEEKEFKVAGRSAYRLAFSHGDVIHLKTVVHRTNLEYYLLDAVMAQADSGKLQPLIEASIATFEILPTPLSSDERAAEGRALDALKGAQIRSQFLGERWFAVHLGPKKVGSMRMKLAASGEMYAFEADVANDYGEGNKDTTLVRGSFSPDGRVQKIDTEQTKVNPKERWQFRASAAIQNGEAKSSRDLNGHKEERSFKVEEGVFFTDVGEFMRAFLVGAGKGSYLLKTLSPYSDEWKVELVEVGGLENLEVDGRQREVILLQSRIDRRRNLTLYYGPDLALVRIGGPKEVFSVRAVTKEEAQK
jgi:hypothetical protein